MAGNGNFYFINDLDEIEKKVIKSFSTTLLEYLLIENMNVKSANDSEIIKQEDPEYAVNG